MRRKNLYIIIMATALVLTACATSKVTEIQPSLSITLEGNPTTGYMWDYSIEGDGNIEAAEETIESTADGILGAPSLFHYSFRGVKKGNVTLIFEYARPWEDGDKLYTETYKLRVNDDLSITEL